MAKCCGVKMEADKKNWEYFCKICTRVEELGISVQTRQEVGWEVHPVSYINLRKVLQQHEITVDVLDPQRWKFLAHVIHDFRKFIFPKSVNYVCFLFDYFLKASNGVWPKRNQILAKLAPEVKNIHPKTRRRAKERFDDWWKNVTLQ